MTVAFEVETVAGTTTLFARSMTELAVTVPGSSEAEKMKTTFVVTGTPLAFAVGFTDETESGVGVLAPTVTKDDVNCDASALPARSVTEVEMTTEYEPAYASGEAGVRVATTPLVSNEMLAATWTAPRRSSHEVAFTVLWAMGSEKVTETEAEMGTFVEAEVGVTITTVGRVVSPPPLPLLLVTVIDFLLASRHPKMKKQKINAMPAKLRVFRFTFCSLKEVV